MSSFFSTVAVALWAMESVAVSPELQLVLDGAIDSSFGPIGVDNPAWSAEGRE